MEDTKAEMMADIFSEFDELDDLDNTNNYTFNDFQNLLDEVKEKKEEILIDSYKASLDEEFNTTKDISLLQDEVLDKLDDLKKEPVEVKIEKKELVKENAKTNEMQRAFIYTSVVGFILLFICYGIYLFIITH